MDLSRSTAPAFAGPAFNPLTVSAAALRTITEQAPPGDARTDGVPMAAYVLLVDQFGCDTPALVVYGLASRERGVADRVAHLRHPDTLSVRTVRVYRDGTALLASCHVPAWIGGDAR